MTNAELIAKLQKFNPDEPVIVATYDHMGILTSFMHILAVREGLKNMGTEHATIIQTNYRKVEGWA